MVGHHPEDLTLGQRGVHGQGRLHQAPQLPGVTGGGPFGGATLPPQQDPFDGDGHPLGQTSGGVEVGQPVPPSTGTGDETEGPEGQTAHVHGHDHHGLDARGGRSVVVTLGLGVVHRPPVLRVHEDLGSPGGHDPTDQVVTLGMAVNRRGDGVSGPRPAGHPAHLARALGQVHGEPVGEGGNDDPHQPGEGIVIGLEGGGHLVSGQGQDGEMKPGVLGPQPAPSGVFIETGPLDRRRRAVGHQLEEPEIAGDEPVLLARSHLDHTDDVATHKQGGGHQRDHALQAQGTHEGNVGHLVHDDGLGSLGHGTDDALTHTDGHPGGGPGGTA